MEAFGSGKLLLNGKVVKLATCFSHLPELYPEKPTTAGGTLSA